MDRLHHINPFAKRDQHTNNTIVTYKVLSIVTWLASVIATIHYSFNKPHDGPYIGHNIWRQNDLYHTGFRVNRVIVLIYWLVMFIIQAIYVSHLFSNTVDRVNQACSVGSHFILNNLLHFAWVMLFVRSFFGLSEFILILNFANLTMLYFRHPGYARFIHAPTVSGPLAWTFVAIYWNGAIMVHHPDHLVARIFANIFVWAILVYGLFFIIIYKDYTMGFNLSVLSAALGVAQFESKVIALQWIFAFIVMSLLFTATVLVAVPAITGRGKTIEAPAVQADAERAPLLADN